MCKYSDIFLITQRTPFRLKDHFLLQANNGAGRNGRSLTVVSAPARLGEDRWTEAGAWRACLK